MKCLLLLTALFACACTKNVSTNPRDTGGGGISWYEGHSARKPGASGTGSSPQNVGQGPVAGSGAQDEPGNLNSPTDSNGGQGANPNPNALL